MVALATVALLPAAPAAAAGSAPGDFTGFAFDTCDAPTQQEMDAWWEHSPYAGVGVYIAGDNRFCDEQEQLSADWVRTQTDTGWRVLPLVVGPQAACSPPDRYDGGLIDDDPTDRYAAARRQGRAEARAGVEAAKALGIGRRSVLWYDLEDFDVSGEDCRRSALAFVSGWTRALHDLGYRSGLYSSASSGIAAVDAARRLSPGSYELPDYLWIAEWDDQPDVRSEYLTDEGWWPHRRVKQYLGDHLERHGDIELLVDSNFMDTGRGTRAGRPARTCGVNVDFVRYHRLARGDRGAQVRAAQCLLRTHTDVRVRVDGRYDRQTMRAARRFQREVGLRPTGRMERRSWTALHAAGGRPLLKFGSGGEPVRRLQRALNAARVADLTVDGVFAAPEQGAVQRYQRERGLERTGVVTRELWEQLRLGKR